MWKDLSLREKSDMMKVAIKNGITSLEEIENKYNEYANGGPIDANKEEDLKEKKQTNWVNNWIRNRKPQMASNIRDYTNTYYGSDVDHWHVSPNPISYYWNKLFGDEQKVLEDNAGDIINEQIQYASKVPIYNLKKKGIYEKNKSNKNMKRFLKETESTQGAFFPLNLWNNTPPEIYISPIYSNDTVFTHEYSHALSQEYKIQQAAIVKELEKHGHANPVYRHTKGDNKYNNKYLDSPDEIYARMMQFRYTYGLDPKKKVTKQDLNKYRKQGKDDFNFLNRYDDNLLLDLLNNVASNKSPKLSDLG